jgi:signal transduction histidine kinase
MNTITYHPVALNGKDFLTLYIIAKHNLTTDVTALINQQRYFTTLIITIIGAVAFIIAFLVFSWNKRLETLVNTRTAELALANEQLKIHGKMQQEFINVAAHELRTPIQPILSITEILHSRIKDSREQELLDVIIRNAKRLNRLSDEILDVTRLETQTLELKKEQFNLNDVILHAVNDMMSSRGFSSKNLKLLYEPRNILLQADKSRIAEVISNLLSNAIKFTPEGTITISIEKDETKNWVVVNVKDTGQGIDVNILPRLFTKFASKSYQGTGLGLFISKGIVEAHGGKIWAENNRDKGATFSFSLPANV